MPLYTQTLCFEWLIGTNCIWNNRNVLQKSLCAHVCASVMETQHIYVYLNICVFDMLKIFFNREVCTNYLVCKALQKTQKWISGGIQKKILQIQIFDAMSKGGKNFGMF